MPGLTRAVAPARRPLRSAVDPAARTSRRMYEGLSSSAVGLELGIAVVLGVMFGRWVDRELGTTPWLMLLFLGFGLYAGFRNVLRAVARAERAEAREADEAGAAHPAGERKAGHA